MKGGYLPEQVFRGLGRFKPLNPNLFYHQEAASAIAREK
jgi:hypothetical protein